MGASRTAPEGGRPSHMPATTKIALLGAAALSAPTAVAPAAAPPLRATLPGAPSVRSQMRDHQHARLLRIHDRLARRADEKEAGDVRLWSNGRLRHDNARLRRALKAGARSSRTGGGAGGVLASIRRCESGGNYATDTGNGFYGAYQFTQSSWEAVGGSGNPAAAS